MQRLFDIVISTTALAILAPILLPIAVLLRLTGEGEVLFPQDRVGKGGRTFRLYKFATMLKNSPNMGSGTVTLKNDPRILPLGRWLRSTKINELPQLINILKGDMSIVGPRPQTLRCFAVFPESAQNAIKQVRPGLSGVGSIIFRNEEDLIQNQDAAERFYDQVIAPYKGALEEWYVQHQGLWTYFACIGVTAWVVVAPKSRVVWKVFPSLPRPPGALVAVLGY